MIWNFIKQILTYPVQWFWKKYEKCKESGDTVKMIILWLVSLTGLVSIGFITIFSIGYLLTQHFNMVMLVVFIIWLYAYVRDRIMKSGEAENVQKSKDMQSILAQADKLYPTMRNIVYQTAKDFAPNIGAKTPRLLGEIEMPEEHYIISNDICYYQFHLAKEDIRMVYSQDDLTEFRLEIQTSLSRKLRSGTFANLQIEQYKDKYGNWLDAVVIDTIEDVGTEFILQMAFSTPEYAEHVHRMRINKQNQTDYSVPDAVWNDKR